MPVLLLCPRQHPCLAPAPRPLYLVGPRRPTPFVILLVPAPHWELALALALGVEVEADPDSEAVLVLVVALVLVLAPVSLVPAHLSLSSLTSSCRPGPRVGVVRWGAVRRVICSCHSLPTVL